MKRAIAFVVLCGVGCGSGSNADTAAVEKYIRNSHANVELLKLEIEEPEYGAFSKVPDSHRTRPWTSLAACGVGVRFQWKDGSRTTRDDRVVWVTSDHQPIDWSGNAEGDNWRKFVRSLAKK